MLTVNDFTSNIITVALQATDDEWTYGLSWYSDALTFCNRVASENGTTATIVAGITAALSPRISWDKNEQYAAEIVAKLANDLPLVKDNGKSYQTKANMAKVVSIWQSDGKRETILEILSPSKSRTAKSKVNGGIVNKTANFFLNIRYNADNCESVTIDAHAAGAALLAYGDNGMTYEAKGIVAARDYHSIACAYRVAAAKMGHAPHALQAVVWLAYRRILGEN